MKISLLAYGSRGDVQPYLALGLGLKARGHEVTFAVPENFLEFVAAEGLRAHPLVGDTKAAMESGGHAELIWKNQTYQFFVRMGKQLAQDRERYWDSILEASQGADLVLSSPVTEFLAQAVAEKVAARCVLSFLAPMVPSSDFCCFALPFQSFHFGPLNRLSHAAMALGWWQLNLPYINDARRRWNLKPWPGNPSARFRKGGGLSLLGYSPSVFPPGSDWGPKIQVTGAWQIPSMKNSAEQNDRGFLDWLEDGPPPIFFGFGSMPLPEPEAFMEMAAELCEELGLRALMGSGWTHISTAACDLPDNLAIVEEADHAWLFPQCAAIVHHGGAGTTHAALRSGVPNLVASFADQPFWGAQVQRLGVGAHLPFRRLSPLALRESLQGVLQEGVQERAAALAGHMATEDGVNRAIDLLEARLLEV